MPWQDRRPMDHRVLFIADCLRAEHSMSELCRLHGISRKTGYKWLGRYRRDALAGLNDQSRKPRVSPQQVPFAIRSRVLELRHCGTLVLGPKKIQSRLRAEFSAEEVPSKTTIYNILKHEGQIESRQTRRRIPPFPQPFSPVRAPNDVWTVDFKGQFCLGDQSWCYPLTIMDLHSRYLLACKAQPRIQTDLVRDQFERLFREHGLPSRIRSDNGAPFASRAVGGLSSLSVWWLRLGILPERIQPGNPQQNGAHERMHRTLKQAATQPASHNPTAQQRRFNQFLKDYNHHRPHEALDQNVPASRYQASPRTYPERIPEPQYPGRFQVRLVATNGLIRFEGHQIYLSNTLAQQLVGLEQVGADVWDVYFGPLRLGGFDLNQRSDNTVQRRYLTLKL